MKNLSDRDLDQLLATAALDDRPASWAATATRGLEARVLQRLHHPASWTDALFALNSWRPLAAAAAVVAITGFWSAPALADVMDDEWLASQAAEEPPDEPLATDLPESDPAF
jgi:hypothetical protein